MTIDVTAHHDRPGPVPQKITTGIVFHGITLPEASRNPTFPFSLYWISSWLLAA
jgi:hypothetical protein